MVGLCNVLHEQRYLAFIGQRNTPNEEIRRISPALIWKQPDCVEIYYCIEWCEDFPPTFGKVRADLRRFGRNVRTLDLDISAYDIDFGYYNCDNYILERYLRLCSQYVGASIEKLRIYTWPVDLQLIQPILNKVKMLALIYYIPAPDENLGIEIPEAKRLMLSGNDLNLSFLHSTWPNLEELAIKLEKCSRNDIAKCLGKNSHLKSLYIRVENCRWLIKQISRKLQVLIIDRPEFTTGNELLSLRGNSKLNKLGLIFGCVRLFKQRQQHLSMQDIRAIGNLKELKYLRSIMLGGFEPFNSMKQIILDLGRNLRRLEHFHIDTYVEPSVIIEFVTNCPHLKSFSSRRHEAYDFLVRTLADIRKTYFENAPVLKIEFLYFWRKDAPTDNEVKSIVSIHRILNCSFHFLQKKIDELAKFVKVSSKQFTSSMRIISFEET